MSKNSRVFLSHSSFRLFFLISLVMLSSKVLLATQSTCNEHLEIIEIEIQPDDQSQSIFLDSLTNEIVLNPSARARIQQKWDKDQVWKDLVKQEVDISTKRLLSSQQSLKHELEGFDVFIPELNLSHVANSVLSQSEKHYIQTVFNHHIKTHMTQMLYKQIEFLSFFKVKQSEVKWLKYFLVQTMSYPFVSIYSDQGYQSFKELMVVFDKLILNLQIQSEIHEHNDFELSRFFEDVEITEALRNFLLSENKKGHTLLDRDELNPKRWNTY